MDTMLTVKDAANYAGVSASTIHYWIKKGWLGDAAKQNVSRGSGCGYKISKAALSRKVHGWTIEDEPKPETKKDVELIQAEPMPDYMKNKESLRMAAANLRIAIDFAQEELSKIEKLL